MVMLLRMLGVLITYRRRGRLPVLDVSVLSMRCWPNDLDLMLHMNNGRYFSAADVGRVDWFLRTGIAGEATKAGVRPVVADASARFSRSLQVFERFEVHSRIVGWNEKWLFAEHRFLRGTEVVATLIARCVFIGRGGRRAPAEILARVGHRDPSPQLPDWVQSWHQGQEQLTAHLKVNKRP